ncbi:MAG TPA: hypothetical protein VFL14_02595 [Xanthomonadales bacterium]|nr:hypothetical protein [Xanthomonadales bacterium]
MTRTNAHTILCVMIRGFAAYGALQLLLQLFFMFQLPRDYYAGWPWWMLWGAYVGSLLLLAAIWMFPGWLARLARTDRNGDVFESDVDARAWLAIAIAVVGLVVAIDAAVDFTRSFLFYREALRAARESAGQMPPSLAGIVVPHAVGFLLGASCMLGSGGIARVVHRIRFGRIPLAEPAAAKPDES